MSLNKTSRSQGEGLLRANVLKALQADPVSGLHHIVLRNMAAEGVMAEAFRQVVLEGGRVRYDFIILIFFIILHVKQLFYFILTNFIIGFFNFDIIRYDVS